MANASNAAPAGMPSAKWSRNRRLRNAGASGAYSSHDVSLQEKKRGHTQGARAAVEIIDAAADESDLAQTLCGQARQAGRLLDQDSIGLGPRAVDRGHGDADLRLGRQRHLMAVLGVAVGVGRCDHDGCRFLRREGRHGRQRRTGLGLRLCSVRRRGENSSNSTSLRLSEASRASIASGRL